MTRVGYPKGLVLLLLLSTALRGRAEAVTTYSVTINFGSSPHPACGGTLVFDFLSSDPGTNTATISSLAYDGHLDTTQVVGGPVSGQLVFGGSGGDSTVIADQYFVNRLSVPFDTIGTYVSFDVTLTESGTAGSLPWDHLALYCFRTTDNWAQPTMDPYGANALFAISATGQSGGVVEAFNPGVVQSGDNITASLTYFCETGGGGCPFVDTFTGDGWRVENSILARSPTGEFSLDAYHLKAAPSASDGRVHVRVRENEQEFTTVDEVRLVAVDHSPDVQAFAVGGRLIVGNRLAAVQVTTTSGVDVTELVDGSGRRFFWGKPGDTLLVRMTGSGAGVSTFSTRETQDGGGEGGMEGDPKEMEAPQTRGRPAPPLSSLDESILASNGIEVQRPDGQGGWRSVTRFYPRRFRDEAVFDSIGVGVLRLVFLGRHRLYWIGRVATGELASPPESLTLMSARHSRLGDQRMAVLRAGGTTTAVIPGDTLTLDYAATAPARGRIRDLFLFTRGVYSSTAPTGSQPPKEEGLLPTSFALYQNQPNPFASTTVIRFDLPVQTSLRLEVFDAQGRLVRTLANGPYPAGFHAVGWDHRTQDGHSLGAGVYLYRIQAGSFRDQKKMVLLGR